MVASESGAGALSGPIQRTDPVSSGSRDKMLLWPACETCCAKATFSSWAKAVAKGKIIDVDATRHPSKPLRLLFVVLVVMA